MDDYRITDGVTDYSFEDSIVTVGQETDYIVLYENMDEYDSIPIFLMTRW